MRTPLLIWITALLPLCLTAASFKTREGLSVEGSISSLQGDLLGISTPKGTWRGEVDWLDDASLGLVADFLAQAPARSPWKSSNSQLLRAVKGRLEVLKADGKLAAFDPGDRLEPEYYLIYFGAYWCGPCRRFSPELLRTYRELKATAPDVFEVIFVSSDHNVHGQVAYAREVGMPWPILRFGSAVKLLDRWRGDGIPCLVVLDRNGEIILHSYQGKEYLGAHDPLEKFRTLHALSARAAAHTPSRHRLAVVTHLREAAGGDRPPAPYLLQVDARRNRTLPKSGLQAQVQIDARGHVVDVQFTPELDAVAADQLRQETENWLFLPAVRGGKAVGAAVNLPITLP